MSGNHLALYLVGEVTDVSELQAGKGGKTYRLCEVAVRAGSTGDDDDATLSVVTAAANVRCGSRVAVAPVGSVVIDQEGNEVAIKRTQVGGVMSEGMLCDSRMLGWTGGALGVAAQMPKDLPVGSCPPAVRPRLGDAPVEAGLSAGAAEPAPGLFKKKLSKEERKRIAQEKRQAKKATA